MTGTFDNWSKSEKLERVGMVFQKTVTLPNASEKIYYKVGLQVLFLHEPRITQPLPFFRFVFIGKPESPWCSNSVRRRVRKR